MGAIRTSAMLVVVALAFMACTNPASAGPSRRLAQSAASNATSRGAVPVGSNVANNSTPKSEGRAKPANGSQAKPNADTKAQVNATLDDSDSTALTGNNVLDQITDAGNNITLQMAAVSNLIRRGESRQLIRVIEDAYALNDATGALVNDVIAREMDAIAREGRSGVEAVAKTIVNATSVGGEEARLFVFSLLNLLSIKGCEGVRDPLTEADRLATSQGKFVERAFIEGIMTDESLVQCLYNTCNDERKGCCIEETRASGRCMCSDTESCDYRLFWQIPQPIWACSFDNTDCNVPKCMCADLI